MSDDSKMNTTNKSKEISMNLLEKIQNLEADPVTVTGYQRMITLSLDEATALRNLYESAAALYTDDPDRHRNLWNALKNINPEFGETNEKRN